MSLKNVVISKNKMADIANFLKIINMFLPSSDMPTMCMCGKPYLRVILALF